MNNIFDMSYKPDPKTGCWNWIGHISKKYGLFKYENRLYRAHRFAWALFRGPITPTQHVLHSCDNPACVNPDRLFLGNQRSNMDDKVAKGRQDRGSKHAMAKLTEADVLAIRKDTRRQTDIAKAYDVTIQTINDIVHRRSWKHI